jgi:hypothetical protein
VPPSRAPRCRLKDDAKGAVVGVSAASVPTCWGRRLRVVVNEAEIDIELGVQGSQVAAGNNAERGHDLRDMVGRDGGEEGQDVSESVRAKLGLESGRDARNSRGR